jgi:hypothetical protein
MDAARINAVEQWRIGWIALPMCTPLPMARWKSAKGGCSFDPIPHQRQAVAKTASIEACITACQSNKDSRGLSCSQPVCEGLCLTKWANEDRTDGDTLAIPQYTVLAGVGWRDSCVGQHGAMAVTASVATDATVAVTEACADTVSLSTPRSAASIAFHGPFPDVQACIDGLTYTSEQDFLCVDVITVTADDLGNLGAGGPLTVTSEVNVEMTLVNDPPSIRDLSYGKKMRSWVLEDSNTTVAGFALSDPDSAEYPLKVTVVTSNAVYSLGAGRASVRFLDGGTAVDSSSTFLCPLSECNSTLAEMNFAPLTDHHGHATITVQADDQGNYPDQVKYAVPETRRVRVYPVNDPPEILHVLPAQTTTEDTAIALGGMALADVDAADGGVSWRQLLEGWSCRELREGHQIEISAHRGREEIAGGGTGTGVCRSSCNARSDCMGYVLEEASKIITCTLVTTCTPFLHRSTIKLMAYTKEYGTAKLEVSAELGELSFPTKDPQLARLVDESGVRVAAGAVGTRVIDATIAQLNSLLEVMLYTPSKDTNGADAVHFLVSDKGLLGYRPAFDEVNGLCDPRQGSDSDLLPKHLLGSTYIDYGDWTKNEDMCASECARTSNCSFFSLVDTQDITTAGINTLSSMGVCSTGEKAPTCNCLLFAYCGTLPAECKSNCTDGSTPSAQTYRLDAEGTDNETIVVDIVAVADTPVISSRSRLKLGRGGHALSSSSALVLELQEDTVLRLGDALKLSTGLGENVTMTLITSPIGALVAPPPLSKVESNISWFKQAPVPQHTLKHTSSNRTTGEDHWSFSMVDAVAADAFANLEITPPADFSGDMGVLITVHSVEPSNGDSAAQTVKLRLEVMPVNDQVVVQLPADQEVREDHALYIKATSYRARMHTIADAESEADPSALVSVKLASKQGGRLSLHLDGMEEGGLSFAEGDGEHDSSMAFTATVADANAALAILYYVAPTNWHGVDSITVNVTDNGYGGTWPAARSGSLPLTTVTKLLNVRVTPMIDWPVIWIGEIQITDTTTETSDFFFGFMRMDTEIGQRSGVTIRDVNGTNIANGTEALPVTRCIEDTPCELTHIRFTDPDITLQPNATFRLLVEVSNGALSLGGVGGDGGHLKWYQGHSNPDHFDVTSEILGTIQDINQAMQPLMYRPANDSNGNIKLILKIEDLCCPNASFSAPSVAAELVVNIEAVNDPPKVFMDGWSLKTPKRKATAWKNVTTFVNFTTTDVNGTVIMLSEKQVHVVIDEDHDQSAVHANTSDGKVVVMAGQNVWLDVQLHDDADEILDDIEVTIEVLETGEISSGEGSGSFELESAGAELLHHVQFIDGEISGSSALQLRAPLKVLNELLRNLVYVTEHSFVGDSGINITVDDLGAGGPLDKDATRVVTANVTTTDWNGTEVTYSEERIEGYPEYRKLKAGVRTYRSTAFLPLKHIAGPDTTDSPTWNPTPLPTARPTTIPTTAPTAAPTGVPSKSPTRVPTGSPTAPTLEPTNVPTSSPTFAPTSAPTATPTAAPTVFPTRAPSSSPTVAPSLAPTELPTAAPSTAPSSPPSFDSTGESISPTAAPSTLPTPAPTGYLTAPPSSAPTAASTSGPTSNPTTSIPTTSPTSNPTRSTPTAAPTAGPTAPTNNPTVRPTTQPTNSPTKVPTHLAALRLHPNYLHPSFDGTEDVNSRLKNLIRVWATDKDDRISKIYQLELSVTHGGLMVANVDLDCGTFCDTHNLVVTASSAYTKRGAMCGSRKCCATCAAQPVLHANGTVNGLNRMLRYLYFNTPKHWYGSAELHIRQLGEEVLLGTKTLEMHPVNDPPSLVLVPQKYGSKSTPLTVVNSKTKLSWFKLWLNDKDSLTEAADRISGTTWTLSVSSGIGGRLRLTKPRGYDHDNCGSNCLVVRHAFTDVSHDPFSASASIVVTGGLALLNLASKYIYYEPFSTEFSGEDTVEVTFSDNGNVGKSTALVRNLQVHIKVKLPTAEPQLILEAEEYVADEGKPIKVGMVASVAENTTTGLKDSHLQITGLPKGGHLESFDAGSAATPSATRRRLVTNNQQSKYHHRHLAEEPGFERSRTVWTLRNPGEITSITVTVPKHMHGNFTLGLTAVAVSVTGVIRKVFREITVFIQAVNNPPTIIVPGAQIAYEGDRTVQIPHRTIQVHDPDLAGEAADAQLAIFVSTLRGQLEAAVPRTGPGSRLSFKGTEKACNEFLANITYFTPAANTVAGYRFMDVITVVVDDLGHSAGIGSKAEPLNATARIPLTIITVNDPPTIRYSGEITNDTLTVAEDSLFVLSPFVVDDPDIFEAAITVTLKATKGVFSYSAASVGAVMTKQGLDTSARPLVTLEVTGSLADVNKALRDLTYTPSSNYVGSDTITASVSDHGHSGIGGIMRDSLSLPVDILSVNDPPTVHVNHASTSASGLWAVEEDGQLQLANLFSVADVDAGALPLSVTLFTALSKSTNLPLLKLDEVDRNSTTLNMSASSVISHSLYSLTVTAPLPLLARTLRGLRYIPPSDVHGTDTLFIRVEDRHAGAYDLASGEAGAGTYNVTSSADLVIIAVNDPPTITVAAAVMYGGKNSTKLVRVPENKSIALKGISVSDVDVAAADDTTKPLLLTVSASWGALNFAGEGSSSILSRRASLDELNKALSGLEFSGGEARSGQAVVSITLSDLGHAGSADDAAALSAQQLVQVYVEPVATEPLCALPPAISGIEGQQLHLPIQARLRDTDGSEQLHLFVRGIPQALQLEHGHHVDNSTWMVSNFNGGPLILRPVHIGFSGAFDITVECRSVELQGTGSSSVASITRKARVSMAARADAPLLSVGWQKLGKALGSEDAWVPMHIDGRLRDTDGSESLKIMLSGVPTSATLATRVDSDEPTSSTMTAAVRYAPIDPSHYNATTKRWMLPAAVARAACIKLAQDVVSPPQLQVVAVATESSNGHIASTTRALALSIEAVADAPHLFVADVAGDLTEPIVLNISLLSGSVTKTEDLQLRLAGVPEKAVVSPATKLSTAGGMSVWEIAHRNYTVPRAPQCIAGRVIEDSSCNMLSACYSWRGAAATCVDKKCVCPQGFCSEKHPDQDGNRCVKLSWSAALTSIEISSSLTIRMPRQMGLNTSCTQDTGGTCRFAHISKALFGCDESRGETECVKSRCICTPGYCAAGGACILASSYTKPTCLKFTAFATGVERTNRDESAAVERQFTVAIGDDYTPTDTICLGDDWSGCPPTINGKSSFKCPNGACVEDTTTMRKSSHCLGGPISGNGCPAHAPRKCADGRCVDATQDCDAYRRCMSRQNCDTENSGANGCRKGWCGLNGCPLTAPFRCTNGECAASRRACDGAVTVCGRGRLGNKRCLHGCANANGECPAETLFDCENEEVRCQDGTCAASTAECSSRACSKNAPFRCEDGSCVSSPMSCTQLSGAGSTGSTGSCPHSTPFRCVHGLCVRTPGECTSKAAATACSLRNSTICPDGTCEQEMLHCAALPSCPFDRPTSCWDGSCARSPQGCAKQTPPLSFESCPTTFEGVRMIRCTDGLCRPLIGYSRPPNASDSSSLGMALSLSCPPSDKCPLTMPHRCWDHSCRKTLTACERAGGCAPGTQQCADASSSSPSGSGKCAIRPSECGVSSRLRTPLAFSATVTPMKEGQMSVIDGAGAGLATVVIPKHAFNCSISTGGTCAYASCYSWRGDTECVGGRCICTAGQCAVDGKCVAEHSLEEEADLAVSGAGFEVIVSPVATSALPRHFGTPKNNTDTEGSLEAYLTEISAIINLTTTSQTTAFDRETKHPTTAPTAHPTNYPTAFPTTGFPTSVPTVGVMGTEAPSASPTSAATEEESSFFSWKAIRAALLERARSQLKKVPTQKKLTVTFLRNALDATFSFNNSRVASLSALHQQAKQLQPGDVCLGCLEPDEEGTSKWECCGELQENSDGSVSYSLTRSVALLPPRAPPLLHFRPDFKICCVAAEYRGFAAGGDGSCPEEAARRAPC